MLRIAVPLAALLVLAASSGADAETGLTLEPCRLAGGLEARCGTFTVPENRAQDGGRTISLRVAVLPARDGGTAADPIVYLAGGPGGSAVEGAAGMASIFAA